jgi:hypothetical protein
VLGSNDKSTAARNDGRAAFPPWDRISAKYPNRLTQANGISWSAKSKTASDIAMFHLAASSCWPASPAIVNFEKRESINKSIVSNGYRRSRVYLQGCGIWNRIAANLAAFGTLLVRALLGFATFTI